MGRVAGLETWVLETWGVSSLPWPWSNVATPHFSDIMSQLMPPLCRRLYLVDRAPVSQCRSMAISGHRGADAGQQNRSYLLPSGQGMTSALGDGRGTGSVGALLT